MDEKPLAEGDERIPNIGTQIPEGTRPLLAALISPGLERALGGRLVGAPEAGLVRKQPEGGEVGIAFFGEDPREIRFDPGGSSQAGVVPQDAERDAIACEPPPRVVARVEKLL